ncbi:hypothetical protein LZZ85_12825 [Terrimonas sp. NA20]|uniref:Uncharacterized protein n=1 Tax=Terrimonas ginsenosidimutans TaxID=2908004 RepID=A0ABS9KS89_9BACT|nr:hypothetical protein [Terrimonas ginsenosidimutans]MCG2615176.1 hypothetical protein [Terrimonas ginsenosidimutans]
MIRSLRSDFFQIRKISSRFVPILLLFTPACNQQPEKIPFDRELNTKTATTIRGKVNNWPTDTVYFATFTFHSPYSTSEGFKVLTPDKTFDHVFDQSNEPFIVFITPERKFLDLRHDVLFENLTDKYYRGYCQKFYDHPITTYLIEPGTETEVNLTKTKRYGKTLIEFSNANKYNSEFYQTTFDLDNALDETLDPRSDVRLKDVENINLAIEKMKSKVGELLTLLNKEQQYISPFLYNYTKSEIEFAGRKEFLRYLLLNNKEEVSKIFSNKIPEEISNVVEFNKENLDHATMISQEYNEFLELYLTFKFSKRNSQLITYKEFDKEKFEFALQELPSASRYFYLANNLLHLNNGKEKELADRLIALYPGGELNDKLRGKYN